MQEKVFDSYEVEADHVVVRVEIVQKPEEFVRTYFLNIPEYGLGTKALLNNIKSTIVADAAIKTERMLDPKFIAALKEKFSERAEKVLDRELPKSDKKTKELLIGTLLHEMLGLGKIEFLLADGNLEEIVINQAHEPVWVYHKKQGWLKTNVLLENEEETQNYAAIIARRVGKQITTLNPLLDAHLITGDRANATLFPISSKGNTITIRRFRREPWTVTDFIENKTASSEVMALIWMAMQFEMNILISGGTASGKTSFMNICMPFIQPNNRIISIEDSVLPETEIVCRQQEKFERTTVGNLVDNAIGDSTIEDIALDNNFGLKIFSMKKNGKIELQEPSKLYRHKVKKTVLDIETESGKKISVTADHSLFCLGEKSEIKALAGKDIKKGTFIATPRILQYETKPVIFDLSQKISLFKSAFVKSTQIAIVIQKSKEMLKGITSKQNIQHSKKAGALNAKTAAFIAELPEDSTIASKYGSKLPLKLEIDETLATAIGLWLADGCYDKNSILFSVVEPECRSIVEKIAARFNTNVKMHSDGITLMLNSCVLKTLFEDILELKGNAYTKRLPAWAFSLPEKEAKALVRGYFSGDGWQRKCDTAIRSASLELLKDTQTMLLRFGIQMRFKRKRLKDKTFEARISETSNLKKFFEEIGFLQTKKMQKLKTATERKKHEVSDIIPLPKTAYVEIKKELKKEVGSRYTYKSWKSWGREYKLNGNISRGRLKEIVSKYKSLEYLRPIAESKIFWDKVASVQEKEYDGFVYDFSVPENESFVCENIVCHNTRELMLPDFLHWIPLTTREPNPEGKGGVEMLDLLVNSLRMRPDRIIVGEVRRQTEAEVMFEGMHTGHSVYTTVHANTAEETIRRLTNPPISIATTMLDAVHLNVVMFRNRRLGVRRMLQVAEFIPEKRGDEESIKTNILYRWRPATDDIAKHSESIRFNDELSLHTGFTQDEIVKEVETKKTILEWMLAQNIRHIDDVGRIMAQYYNDEDSIIALAKANKKPDLLSER